MFEFPLGRLETLGLRGSDHKRDVAVKDFPTNLQRCHPNFPISRHTSWSLPSGKDLSCKTPNRTLSDDPITIFTELRSYYPQQHQMAYDDCEPIGSGCRIPITPTPKLRSRLSNASARPWRSSKVCFPSNGVRPPPASRRDPHDTSGRTFPNDPIMLLRRCLVACSIPIPRVHDLRRIMFS